MRLQLRIGILSLAALAALPLRTDGGQPECLNAAASLSAMRNDPVAGDEAFFKLPTGPGNVMFLYDQSGSMFDIPQCPNQRWGSGLTCRAPSITAPNRPNGNPTTVAVAGTCAPGSQLTGTYTWYCLDGTVRLRDEYTLRKKRGFDVRSVDHGTCPEEGEGSGDL